MCTFIRYDWERLCFISGKQNQCQYWLNHNAACMSDIYIFKKSHHYRTVCHPFLRMKCCLTPPTHLPIVLWPGYLTMIAFNQQYIHQHESALAWSSPQGIPQAGSSWEGSLINLAGMHQRSERGTGGGGTCGGGYVSEHSTTLFCYLYIPFSTFPLQSPPSPKSDTFPILNHAHTPVPTIPSL